MTHVFGKVWSVTGLSNISTIILQKISTIILQKNIGVAHIKAKNQQFEQMLKL